MAKKKDYTTLLIDRVMNKEEYEQWDSFLEDIDADGETFGDAEVQKALSAGYTIDDVNSYLKFSGITPTGSFGVAGYNESQVMGGSGDGMGFSTQKDPYYRYFGPVTAAPAPPPDPTAYNPGAVQTYTPTAAVADNFNPNGLQIRMPESDPMIAQLQQNLISAVRPPDTSQLTNQLAGIQSSVQQSRPAVPSLGQGVSLDSFSKIAQQQAGLNTTPTPAPTVNTNVDGLTQAYSDQLGTSQLSINVPKSNPTRPNLQQTSYDAPAVNQASGIDARIKSLQAMQNQAGWRNRAAMQIGSQSANSVQTASMGGASGTDKLNRNNRNSAYLRNLTIGGAGR